MGLFDFPLVIAKDSDYLSEYKKRVTEYIDFLFSLKNMHHLQKYSANIDAVIKETKNIQTRITRAFNSQFNGNAQSGINIIVNLVKKYNKKLVTEILDSYAFLGMDYYSGEKLEELYLYKGRVNSENPYVNYSPEEMFHIPLDLRKLTTTQRYSMPGIPCIYLAQNSYVVWKEMQMPRFDSLSVSAFKIKDDHLKMIDLTYPFKIVSELICDPDDFKNTYERHNDTTSAKLIIGNLSLFPLTVAVSIKCKEENRKFKSEYVIPQLLMYALKKDIIGIAYHSNEIPTSNNMFATNIAIPIIDFNPKEKYGNVKQYIEVTEPINFDYFNKFYNQETVMKNINTFAKGINNGSIFSNIQPLSTFNKLIFTWTNASYDKDIQYSKTPFYNFDDYILYLKQFNKIK